ncbi:MAG: hypothetical protein JKY81_01770 [Colwellia sp.]|nr:hypothetical protein [Colwellia sp.]
MEPVEAEPIASEASGEEEPPAPQEEEVVTAEEPLEAAEPNTTPPVVDEDAIMGRVAAVMAERDKRQAAETRNTELEARIKQLQQSQKQAPQTPIDPLDDFAGFQAQQDENLLTQRMDMSEDMARMHHGDETVDTMQLWWREQMQANPVMHAQFSELRKSRNPYQALITQYNQHQMLADIGNDPAAYKARIIEEHLAGNVEVQSTTPALASIPAKAKVPTSLAKGGGTVGEITTDDADDFASVFN